MFRGFREADYIMDKVLLVPMEQLFRHRGLVLGFWSENGFRHFGGDRPFLQPQHLRGQKMRSQEYWALEYMLKWVSSAPFGFPVVPEV